MHQPPPQTFLQSVLDEFYRFAITLIRVQIPRGVVPLRSWLRLLVCHGLLSYPFIDYVYRRHGLSFDEIDRPAGFLFLSAWFLLLLVLSCVLLVRGPRPAETEAHDYGRPVWAWGSLSTRWVWWLETLGSGVIVAALFTPSGCAWYYRNFGENDILRVVLAVGFAWRLVRESCGVAPGRSPSSSDEAPNAVWATAADIAAAGLRRPPGVFLGYWDGKELRTDAEGNIILFAPARSGKTSCNIIPLCKESPNDLLVLDVKGEIHRETAADRIRLGHTVVRWDPFGVRGLGGARFNPLSLLSRDDPNLNEFATLLADLIVQVDPNERDHHFADRARKFIQVFLLYVMVAAHAGRRDLCYVRHLLTRPQDVFECVLAGMAKCEAVDGLIRDGANMISSADPRERANVLATVHRHIAFLDSPAIREHFAETPSDSSAAAETTFDPRAFADPCRTTVYMIMPPDKLAAYSRVIRIWIGCTLDAITRAHGRPVGSDRLCVVLDEFAQLGRMPQIVQAMTGLGGFGVSIFGVLQSLSQLRTIYPHDEWQTIVANSKYQMYSCVNDIETARWVSASLGDRTIVVPEETVGQNESYSRGASWTGWWAAFFGGDVNRQRSQQQGASRQVHYGHMQRPLLTPDEIMRLPRDQQILLISSTPPILSKKIPYFKKRWSLFRFWRR